ncbi:MAG: nitroreductase family protein [Clostridioides sp.]|nr:nitroreductase family protein [Clostridioides sp.]
MDIYEAIFYRMTTREFSIKKVKKATMQEIKRICKDIDYLNKELAIEAHVVERGHIVQFLMRQKKMVKAPHYIVITSEVGEDYLQNVGYLAEKIVLELTSLGIGTCWLESVLSEDDMKELVETEEVEDEFVFSLYNEKEKKEVVPCGVIGFGYPEGEELFRRRNSTPERKSVKDISKGFKEDNSWQDVLDMVRRAPSIGNSQPWFFYKDGNIVHMYEKNPKRNTEDMSKISMGAALRHFDIACKENGIEVRYEKLEAKKRMGKEYFISMK